MVDVKESKMMNDVDLVGGPSASYQRGSNLIAGSGFEESVGGSDIERGEAARIASIPPARVPIPSDSPVVQVSCGLHHTGESRDHLRYNLND